MGSIVDSALARSGKIGHLDDPIGKCLARIMDTEGTIHVMTKTIAENRVSMASVTRLS